MFWRSAKNFKCYDTLNFFVNARPYGAGDFEILLLSHFLSVISYKNVMRTMATMVEYRMLLFLAIGYFFFKCATLKLLTCESMGKAYKRPMGLGALLNNQLGHELKFQK